MQNCTFRRCFSIHFSTHKTAKRQDKKAVKRSSDSQSNTMFASLVMKPICDFYDSVYMDLDRERLQGMRKQIKVQGALWKMCCEDVFVSRFFLGGKPVSSDEFGWHNNIWRFHLTICEFVRNCHKNNVTSANFWQFTRTCLTFCSKTWIHVTSASLFPPNIIPTAGVREPPGMGWCGFWEAFRRYRRVGRN